MSIKDLQRMNTIQRDILLSKHANLVLDRSNIDSSLDVIHGVYSVHCVHCVHIHEQCV